MEEGRRMEKNGYEGNMEDKIFKSSRYYFMKKSNDKKDAKKRKKYTSKNDSLLDTIKMHIERTEITKPSESYDDFVKNKNELLNMVKEELINSGDYNKKEAELKIKKIYKNKFYIHQKSMK